MATPLEIRANFAHSARVDGKPKPHGYEFADTLATIQASGYFDPIQSLLLIGDNVSIKASDGQSLYKVVTLNPVTILDVAGDPVGINSAGGYTVSAQSTTVVGANNVFVKIQATTLPDPVLIDFTAGSFNELTYTGAAQDNFLIIVTGSIVNVSLATPYKIGVHINGVLDPLMQAEGNVTGANIQTTFALQRLIQLNPSDSVVVRVTVPTGAPKNFNVPRLNTQIIKV